MEFGLEMQNVQSYIHINRSKTTTHGSKVGVFFLNLHELIFIDLRSIHFEIQTFTGKAHDFM